MGFIFFAIAIGMATGTKFYLLAIIAAIVISLVVLIMNRFETCPSRTFSWTRSNVEEQECQQH